jgi:D-arabinose 1-dehydrogenase-like Zn-dependent alcohol dehydrogenase
MLSYEVIEYGKPLQARLHDTPTPVGRQVVVRITHCGVCHSDVHLWKGYFNLGGGKKDLLSDRGVLPPRTLGHEPLGIVTALGPEVRDVAIGQKRLVYPWIGCDKCWACEAGLSTLCAAPRNLGIGLPGAFATRLLVPDAKYLVDVGGIDDGFAATLACSGVTSYSAVAKVLPNVLENDWVAVIGCGGLGLLTIAILKALGLKKIVACDIEDGKLEAARSQGAVKVIRSDLADARAVLKEATEGRLAAAIDYVGQPRTFELPYAVLRKGGTYVLCGLHGGELTLPMPPIALRSIAIIGSFVGTLDDLTKVVELAKSGRLQPTPTTTKSPDEINSVLEDLDLGRGIGRTVLDFSAKEESL